MALLDNFSGDGGSQLNQAVSSLKGSNKVNTNPSSEDVSGSSYYKVYIVANTEKGQTITIVADGPSEFAFDTSVEYETPYQNLVGDTIDMAAGAVGATAKKIADMAQGVAKASGTKMFTQALTAKVWSGGGTSRLSVPLIFQVEDNPEKDVLLPLMQLMYLSMPREDTEGGWLSSPGPRFDITGATNAANSGGSNPANSASQGGGGGAGTAPAQAGNTSQGTMQSSSGGVAMAQGVTSAIGKGSNSVASTVSSNIKKSVKNPISVRIGQAFFLDNVVILSVGQTQRMAPIGEPGQTGQSSGINSMVKVDVVFEGFFTLTQRDLKNMLIPMAKSGDTMGKYNSYIG